MKQKRAGLVIANVLPIIILFGEIALLAMQLTGWAIGISIAVAIISLIIFCSHSYAEETIFFVANLGYMLAIILPPALSSLLNPTAQLIVGILFGVATAVIQGILTDVRTQGRI